VENPKKVDEFHSTERAKVKKPLSPQAQRALAEAAKRRKQQSDAEKPKELGGPKGPEPTRYGDWEKGGLAHDF
jgi:hypothetical protein